MRMGELYPLRLMRRLKCVRRMMNSIWWYFSGIAGVFFLGDMNDGSVERWIWCI